MQGTVTVQYGENESGTVLFLVTLTVVRSQARIFFGLPHAGGQQAQARLRDWVTKNLVQYGTVPFLLLRFYFCSFVPVFRSERKRKEGRSV
jgi:hypothetical protein